MVMGVKIKRYPDLLRTSIQTVLCLDYLSYFKSYSSDSELTFASHPLLHYV